MFVLAKKYKKLEEENLNLRLKVEELKIKNASLGLDNLNLSYQVKYYQELMGLLGECILSKTMIARLISIVHPDKHFNESKFVEITGELIKTKNAISKFCAKVM